MERGPAEVLWPPTPILLVNRLSREAVPVGIGECQGSHGMAARLDRGKRCGRMAEKEKRGLHWAISCPQDGRCNEAQGDCERQLTSFGGNWPGHE
ncbi:hypothetical protein NDU88_001449 [Pleurodeles waltl]|uniref:Uncharacterized protein n=1 Tax=Pleurodeles waltl TaxID=8319 RepID=A0AAV7TIS3_PLEWA|nr:hypothetical protein NDU88_001449 [Pleurodeles waltl]